MAEEGFFKRWSRRKIEAEQGHELPPEPAPAPLPDADPAPVQAQVHVYARAGELADADAHPSALTDADTQAPAREAGAPPPPTMADVALLTPQSDFSAFVRQGVDADVRRTALKKLFTDPHFNTMDRLDVYIDDYTKPSPVSKDMLASLRHAKSVFQHLTDDEEADAAREAVAQDAVAQEARETQQTQDPQDPLQEPRQDPLPPTLEPNSEPTPEPQAADAYQLHPPETETR